MSEKPHPVEGQVVLLAGAKASVTLKRLSELLERAQQYVRSNRDTYENRFERITGKDDRVYYLVEAGHWDEAGGLLGFDARESDAIRRAHTAQFTRDGRRLDRLEEFETALDIREVVVFDNGPA